MVNEARAWRGGDGIGDGLDDLRAAPLAEIRHALKDRFGWGRHRLLSVVGGEGKQEPTTSPVNVWRGLERPADYKDTSE
jgi:hypothetical protein